MPSIEHADIQACLQRQSKHTCQASLYSQAMDIIDRLDRLMELNNIQRNQRRKMLAYAAGISPSAVGQWYNGSTGNIKNENLAKIVAKYGGTVDWLITGNGELIIPSDGGRPIVISGSHSHVDSNVEAAPFSPSTRKLPVISYVQAGMWGEAIDIFQPGDAEEWEEAPAAVGSSAFWLRVKGDSMTAPVGQSIPAGHLILVDPEIAAENGSLVIAKLTNSDEVTFKKLVIDAGQKYLKPLNPSYPVLPIDQECRIVGVVREAKVKLY